MNKRPDRLGIFFCLILCIFTSLHVSAERPRILVSEPVQQESSLSTLERKIIDSAQIQQVLREALIDSRSFRVVARDNDTVQVLLNERDLQDKSIARKGQTNELGLDIADYFLIPSILSFSVHTSYQAIELVDDFIERRDRYAIDVAIKVVDSGGNTVFEERIERSQSFLPREVPSSEKNKNTTCPCISDSLKKEMKSAGKHLAYTLINRINPITVLKVSGKRFQIDRGQNSGFDEATVFEVRSEEEIVVHPRTGEELLVPGIKLGTAKVATFQGSFTELEMTEGDIASVKPGAIVYVVKEK